MRSVKLLFSLVILAVSMACGDSPTAPPPVLDVPYSATDMTVGTGTEATAGKFIRVYYTGWIYSTNATDNKGTQFETNVGGAGLNFPLGAGQVIKGWDQGIVGMKVGGKRRLILPPNLAYGEGGSGSTIPPNAHLIFEVELLSVAG